MPNQNVGTIGLIRNIKDLPFGNCEVKIRGCFEDNQGAGQGK